MSDSQTIAAIATAPGRGGIGIVRISGNAVRDIVHHILDRPLRPGRASHRRFVDAGGETIDSGIALLFSEPHSYTGEDVLELQGHGGPVVMDLLLQRAIGLGARIARPGEFTERAFLNDKLDLAQAEAVADLIDSQTSAAARSALRSLEGEFSAGVNQRLQELVRIRTWIEAAIDFPDEEIDFLADSELDGWLENVANDLTALLSVARQGALLSEGITLVIAGPPNVGKSSLINRLTGRETAIVTAIPGTTRDPLRANVQLGGLPVEIIDTAGLRATDDDVERIGVARAHEAIASADVILVMVDDRTAESDLAMLQLPDLASVARILVRNKIDLAGTRSGRGKDEAAGIEIRISALTGDGVEELVECIRTTVGATGELHGTLAARRRHVSALERCREHVRAARTTLQQGAGGELSAEELRQAQHALGEITGVFTNDDLLGHIFSEFCLGK